VQPSGEHSAYSTRTSQHCTQSRNLLRRGPRGLHPPWIHYSSSSGTKGKKERGGLKGKECLTLYNFSYQGASWPIEGSSGENHEDFRPGLEGGAFWAIFTRRNTLERKGTFLLSPGNSWLSLRSRERKDGGRTMMPHNVRV